VGRTKWIGVVCALALCLASSPAQIRSASAYTTPKDGGTLSPPSSTSLSWFKTDPGAGISCNPGLTIAADCGGFRLTVTGTSGASYVHITAHDPDCGRIGHSQPPCTRNISVWSAPTWRPDFETTVAAEQIQVAPTHLFDTPLAQAQNEVWISATPGQYDLYGDANSFTEWTASLVCSASGC